MEDLPHPAATEFPPYYARYIDQAEGRTLEEALRIAADRTRAVITALGQRGDHRYAPDKWSVKEVLQHVVDSERIFAYRALRFARNDATPLPGYEENDYAPASCADRRTLRELLAEYDTVHAATVSLFGSFDRDMGGRSGVANGQRISVAAIGWVIAGHAMHHAHVLTERYTP